MNLMAAGSNWDGGGQAPPLWWSGLRFEVNIAPEDDVASFLITLINPAAAGDHITFNYLMSAFSAGFSPLFLNICNDSTGDVVQSVNLSVNPSGQVDFVCEAGVTYRIVTAESVDSDTAVPVDSLTLVLSASTAQALPWWMCAPKPEPDAVQERPTGFVPFSEYDAEFRYPLASSRVPRALPKADAACDVCGPTLVPFVVQDPDGGGGTDPDPVCANLEVSPYDEMVVQSHSSMPSWFVNGETESFQIRFPGLGATIYTFTWTGFAYAYDASGVGGNPFGEDYEQTLVGEIAQDLDILPEDIEWTCLNATTYVPV